VFKIVAERIFKTLHNLVAIFRYLNVNKLLRESYKLFPALYTDKVKF